MFRRYLTLIILSVITLAAGSTGCGQDSSTVKPVGKANVVTDSSRGTKMKVKIGPRVFDAMLFDNPTAAAFKAMLPITLEMEELNGNEKKFDLAKALPTDASDPKAINSGDLMIWGDRTVVLFYKTFPTSYSYSKLGRISDPTGLEAAVGTGNVQITFELDRSPEE